MGRSKEDPDRVLLGNLSATPMRERGQRDDGARYWRIRTRDTRRTLRSLWATTDQVEAVVSDLHRRGGPPTQSRTGPGGVRTVGELLRRWLDAQRVRHKAGEIAERTLVNYDLGMRSWLSAVDEVLVAELTRELVEDTLRSWRADGVAPRTARTLSIVLRAAVRWGQPRGYVGRVELQRLRSVEFREDEYVNCARTPTRTEVDRVLQAIPAGRNRDLVELLALTGMRVGEAAALRVGDYDLETDVLTISGRDDRRRRRGKVRPRQWPVLGALRLLLRRLVQGRGAEEDLVAGLPGDASKVVLEALDAASAATRPPVDRFTAHGLRRLVAEELLQQPGSDAKSVSELTGHTVEVLLRIYVRPSQARLRDLVHGAHSRRGVVVALRAQDDE